MEEKEEIKQISNQQEQTKDEMPDRQAEINQEDKVVPVLEPNKLLDDDTKEERYENGAKTSVENGKVGESLIHSSKALKQGSKQNPKTKLTISQPFSLATEKRMSRERRGSMDFKDSKPKLSKSSSFNYKVYAQSSLGAEGTSDLRNENSTTKTSIKPKVTTTERVDKRVEIGPKTKGKIQVKEVESKNSQVNAKEGKELEINKLRKTSTFKASPLPSFYHRKHPPSLPEIKKIPVTRPKSPLLGQRSKSMPNSADNNTEDKGKRVSRIVSSNAKETEDKGKRVSKTISSSAKETINKLFRTTRKAMNSRKETMKGVILKA